MTRMTRSGRPMADMIIMMIMNFILSRKKYDRLYYILQKVKNVKNISKC